MDNPANDEDRDDGDHEDGHDPGVYEGDDKSEEEAGQCFNNGAQPAACGLGGRQREREREGENEKLKIPYYR